MLTTTQFYHPDSNPQQENDDAIDRYSDQREKSTEQRGLFEEVALSVFESGVSGRVQMV